MLNIALFLKVPFAFVGRKTAIENAKLMMNYHLDHLKVTEKFILHTPHSKIMEVHIHVHTFVYAVYSIVKIGMEVYTYIHVLSYNVP